MAGAALAFSLATSQAQVYSANIVGYYNVTVPAGKTALIADQLSDSTNGYGINAQLTNGVANNSVLYKWNGGGFDTYIFYTGFGWYKGVEVNPTTDQLPAGTSAFLQNGDTGNPMTLTVVGTVPTNSPVAIPAGSGFYSMGTPIATNLDSTLANFPSQYDGASASDLYYPWNVAAQSFSVIYVYYGSFGWYNGATQVYPTPNVGEGFLYYNSGISTNWNFTFQP